MQLAEIENPKSLSLPPQGKEILRRMFVGYERVIIEQELGGGFSRGRIFVVRPFKTHGAELLAVVKMAPTPLIEKERQAYQTHIHNRLPNAQDIQASVYTGDETWAGLRYPLVGGGVFQIQSLYEYLNRSDIELEQIVFTLDERLLKIMGHLWRANEARHGFSIRESYDHVLPVNLIIQPLNVEETRLLDKAPRHLTPQTIAAANPQPDDIVRLEGFAVTLIEPLPDRTDITLNQPQSTNRPAGSYRFRLQVAQGQPLTRYEVGKTITITGRVVTTRAILLQNLVGAAVGQTIDLSLDPLPLPGQSVSEMSALPNPLSAYPHILGRSLDVRIAQAIHGDLNLENILVDPHTGDVNLIDFADARRDCVLHDLLRLETGIVTRLLAPALAEANLPPATIYTVYQKLHQAVIHATPFDTQTIAPPLENPFTVLMAIRRAARRYLFDYDDFTEYYQGLSLYLLGALKFSNLDNVPEAKTVAFWGAATLVDLTREPVSVSAKPGSVARSTPVTKQRSKAPFLWLGIGGAAVILLGLLIALGVWAARSWPVANQSDNTLIATVIGLHPKVQRQTTGTDRLIEVDFGANLYQGDMLYTQKGASVDIACANGLLLHLPEQRNMAVECVEDTTIIKVIGRLDRGETTYLVNAPDSVLDDISTIIQRAPGLDQTQLTRLLTPRNSLIADPRPTFYWQPVAGAGGYRLTVTSAGGKTWMRETTATRLPYPAEAPPLAPGSVNVVELTTLDDTTGTAVDKSLLRLPDETGLTKLTEAETGIQALSLDASTQRYLLTQLYSQHKMWSAAIEQLVSLVETQQPPSANLWQQLGDLYMEVELYPQAQKSYAQALAAAKQTDEASAQAAAQVGLAYTAVASNDIDQAIAHLNTAETLYRKNGQPDLAEQVAVERKKLE